MSQFTGRSQSPEGSLTIDQRARVFAPEVIQLSADTRPEVPFSIRSPALTKNGRDFDVDAVRALVGDIRRDVEARFAEQFGRPWNQFQLGDKTEWARQQFHADARFAEVLGRLDIDIAEAAKIYLPWWNERVVREIDFNSELGAANFEVSHSYVTQFVRRGGFWPGISVSIVGVMQVAADAEYPDGGFVIRLRAGGNYPNCYHTPAGSLSARHLAQSGSIYKTFLATELCAETGVPADEIRSGRFLGRVFDRVIGNDVSYVFQVTTELTAQQVDAAWNRHTGTGKEEHRRLEFIPATKVGMTDFIDRFYVPNVKNDLNRAEADRRLLHPGALAFVAALGLPMNVLERHE